MRIRILKLAAVLVFVAVAGMLMADWDRVYADKEYMAVSSADRIANSLKKKSSCYGSKCKKFVPLKNVKGYDQKVVWKLAGKKRYIDERKEQTERDLDVDESDWDRYYSEEDLRLMSSIIYCEAGSMSEAARVAVANVIINRMNSTKDWGHVNTIEEVVYDDRWTVQFTPTQGNPSPLDQALYIYDNLEEYEGDWKYKQMLNCISSAKKAFCGAKAVPDSYMYFNSSIERSIEKCEEKGLNYTVIDHHIYF